MDGCDFAVLSGGIACFTDEKFMFSMKITNFVAEKH